MRHGTRLTLSLALALGTAGFCFAQPSGSDNNTNANRNEGKLAPLALPSAFQQKEMNTDGIAKELARVTKAAGTRGDFRKIVRQLNDENQKKAKNENYKDINTSELDGIIDAINKQWKDKY